MFEIHVCGHRAGRSVEYSMAIITVCSASDS